MKDNSKKKNSKKKETVVFDNSKPKKTASFFPKIYRFITEEWKLIASSIVSGIIIFGITFQGVNLYYNLQKQQEIEFSRSEVERELLFWKEELGKYPDHRDIYFNIATLEYRLGNKDEAKSNLDKALSIDPNFEEGREMEKLIGI